MCKLPFTLYITIDALSVWTDNSSSHLKTANKEIKRFTFTTNGNKRNLYHVTKFSAYFSFTVYCFYTKISSFIPVLSIRILLDCFYLLILSAYFLFCLLTFAVNVNLNLSNV